MIFWILENAYCIHTNSFEFHAFIWHLLTCIGLYYVFQIILCHRLFVNTNSLKRIENKDILPKLSYVDFQLA